MFCGGLLFFAGGFLFLGGLLLFFVVGPRHCERRVPDTVGKKAEAREKGACKSDCGVTGRLCLSLGFLASD